MASKGIDFVKALIGKVLPFTGLAVAILAWIIILLSMSYNPWFVFTKHAFSDLGGPKAENPLFYNHGMIMLGFLSLLYSLSLIRDAVNKVEAVGGAFMFTAGIFLALIGVYPSGTRPHNFVSTWFFTQTDLAIITWGIGLLFSDWKIMGMVFTGMAILGTLAAAIIEWPSVAVLEAYGIVLIDAWIVLMLKVHIKRTKKSKIIHRRFE